MACHEFKKSLADPYHCLECKGLLEDHVQLPSVIAKNVPVQEDLTFITVVLDRSGSMASTQKETIEGFNEFLNGQRMAPGAALLTLVQFDDEYEIVYDGVSLPKVEPRSATNYVPRGMTALFDAMGKAMAVTTEKIDKLVQKPARNIFVVITDGGENQSKEYKSAAQLHKMIADRKELGWQFLFIGSDEAGLRDADKIELTSNSYKGAGFAKNAQQYTRSVYTIMNASVNSVRGMSSHNVNISADTLSDNYKAVANATPAMSGDAAEPPTPLGTAKSAFDQPGTHAHIGKSRLQPKKS